MNNIDNERGELLTTILSGRSAVVLMLVSILSACAVTPRPTPPPEGAPVEQAWGAVPPEATIDKSFSDSLVNLLRERYEQARAADDASKIPYRALTLSGGGSRGAYGAGVLIGWTERGDRPEFDVVTGISTGPLWPHTRFLDRISTTIL